MTMNAAFFRVVSQGETSRIERQDGTTVERCTIILQVLGERGDFGRYAATLLGGKAAFRFQPGDAVAASLRFTTHSYEGRTYQDITVQDIIKLS